MSNKYFVYLVLSVFFWALVVFCDEKIDTVNRVQGKQRSKLSEWIGIIFQWGSIIGVGFAAFLFIDTLRIQLKNSQPILKTITVVSGAGDMIAEYENSGGNLSYRYTNNNKIEITLGDVQYTYINAVVEIVKVLPSELP